MPFIDGEFYFSHHDHPLQLVSFRDRFDPWVRPCRQLSTFLIFHRLSTFWSAMRPLSVQLNRLLFALCLIRRSPHILISILISKWQNNGDAAVVMTWLRSIDATLSCFWPLASSISKIRPPSEGLRLFSWEHSYFSVPIINVSTCIYPYIELYQHAHVQYM